MLDASGAITRFITAPPTQLAAGAVLGAVVKKCFDASDAVLKDAKREDLAIKLLYAEDHAKGFATRAQRWPETFATVFDQVFGEKHFTLRCFWRSCIVSFCGVTLMFLLWGLLYPVSVIDYFRLNHYPVIEYLPRFPFIAAIPDYLSLLKSRKLIKVMNCQKALIILLLILVDILATAVIAGGFYGCYEYVFFKLGCIPLERYRDAMRILHELPTLKSNKGYAPLSALLYPSLFTTVWVTLYGLSWLVLRVAKQTGSSMGFFNEWFDTERKPLQAIGLVSAVFVMVVYWTFSLGGRLWR